ncbi:hypothetical protein AB1L42_01140 [Thalassoglobus sp. JC818]|uniref:hypothetical protein n=1 Tax=Thalassoglobus sp. JC818 TaxID=3232136 RepID=UPI00345A45B3
MFRKISNIAIAVLTLFLFVEQANAHYLWVIVENDQDDNRVANIYFEEAPSAGDGHYLDHFLGSSDVWVRTISHPNPEPVKATEVKQDKNRWLRVKFSDADEYSIDTYGKFGVYEYGSTKVLLHYYARTLKASSHDAIHELGRAEQLDLDFVPHDIGDQLELTLLWKGKPVSDRMVFIRGPKGFRMNVKTNDRGRVFVEPAEPGRYTFRSSVEEPTPGSDNGEDYELIRHNITILLDLPLEK